MSTRPNPKKKMDCIVVGGCANGVLLKDLHPDAQFIRLSRPDYVKPLTEPNQTVPDIENIEDDYEIHPLGLVNTGARKPILFGIAVVRDKSLTWAFTQLVIGFVEHTTAVLASEGLIEKH